MDERNKEVYFSVFCKKCKHWDLENYEDPCHECLNTPTRPDSHTPIEYDPVSREKQTV